MCVPLDKMHLFSEADLSSKWLRPHAESMVSRKEQVKEVNDITVSHRTGSGRRQEVMGQEVGRRQEVTGQEAGRRQDVIVFFPG